MQIEINSVSEYINKCFSIPKLKKSDTRIFYRGVNRIIRENPHIPSLYYPPNQFWKHEDTIFNEVVSLFPEEMLAQPLTIEKLFIMRHYGFPTRILDISTNPLVDLFFACFANKGQEDTQKKDGIVYVYAVPEEEIKFCDSDTVTILANLCKMPNDFSVPDIADEKKFNEHYQIKDLLHRIHEDFPGYLPVIQKETFQETVCLRPRMNNPRIVRQQGYFFLFGIDGKKEKCAKLKNDWIKDPIVIPADCKKPILNELADMGYDEGFFYPDFEHVNNVLRTRYA
jgi:hypothetical protein